MCRDETDYPEFHAGCPDLAESEGSMKNSHESLFKRSFQTVLRRLGLNYRMKTSRVYDLYWSVINKHVIEARTREIHFYQDLLKGFRQGDLIFDVGANDGTKTDVFLRLGAHVIAVEPDERNQAILREKFLRYRLVAKPVEIVGKAASERTATEIMWVDGPGSALNTLSQKWVETLQGDKVRFKDTHGDLDFARRKAVETTTLEELIVKHGSPFFVKIDVEGYEICVLRGLKRPVPFLSFEINLPEFRPEGLECVRLLESLSADGRFNCTADLQRGLMLDEYADARTFSEILERCSEKTIEVFWKTSRTAAK